jgi:hypothetical protein
MVVVVEVDRDQPVGYLAESYANITGFLQLRLVLVILHVRKLNMLPFAAIPFGARSPRQ